LAISLDLDTPYYTTPVMQRLSQVISLQEVKRRLTAVAITGIPSRLPHVAAHAGTALGTALAAIDEALHDER
jgi:hypothetical protein